MARRKRALLVLGATAGVLALGVPGAFAAPVSHPQARHVLLLSVDGMHAADLAFYVRTHPASALASLVHSGTTYTNARTTFPSDSFPGMVAQVTGARPATSGVFYDDTYNPSLLAPGTRDCSSAAPGTEVSWTEAADRSQAPLTLDAGQGLSAPALTNLPTNTLAQTLAAAPAVTSAILSMTPQPQTLLDPAALPLQPSTCLPVYPHRYLKVNTVFEVAHSAGLRTAWSDKHPAYEILNGPSGTGVQDLFTPEINSVADSAGDDWTTDNALTTEYDGVKVAAVLNEIAGRDHSGAHVVGTPAIFGMNFQTVSTAQKLPTSDGLAGGYLPDGTPGPLLSRALDYVDASVGQLQAAIAAHHLGSSTTIILSAKHGQAPIDPADLRRVDDGAVLSALDDGWASTHPGAKPLVTFSVDDDLMLLWLSDRRPDALAYAKSFLLAHSAPANRVGDPKGTTSTTVPHSGLRRIYVGTSADARLRASAGDRRVPDLVGIARRGVVYTGGVKKIAEHGGAAAADRNVPLVVSGAGVRHGSTRSARVQTTSIAPTILELLGLDPRALSGVRLDHTPVLPRLMDHTS